MKIIWQEIESNDEPITPGTYTRVTVRTYIYKTKEGYLFKQMCGSTCLGITFVNGDLE